MLTNIILAKKCIPIIKSVLIDNNQVNIIQSEITYPCIIKKSTNTSQGKDVHLAKNVDTAKKIFLNIERN